MKKESLPKELQKYLQTVNTPEQLLEYYSEMKLEKKHIAPEDPTRSYKPAIQMRNGEILWHSSALIHADVIELVYQDNLEDFNPEDVLSTGGIAPDGSYYRTKYKGDV